ncbi:hypothetical protein STANM309S_03798 [Streptomyces tanashiensis]
MRADRLVAALLFLQTRRRVTAAELALELGVSERTARRDLEALASAGIPVYSQAGQGGGWSLVGGARTDLTGLTAPEIRELFLLTGPDTGADHHTRTALRKLVRGPPRTPPRGRRGRRPRRDRRRHRLDGSGDRGGGPPGRAPAGRGRGTRAAHRIRPPGARAPRADRPAARDRREVRRPLLLANTADGLRTFRVGRVTSVTETGAPAGRPEGFDLATAWRALAARMEDRMVAATVRGQAAPGTETVLEGLLGGRIRYGERGPDGWTPIEADGPSPEVIAAQLADLAPAWSSSTRPRRVPPSPGSAPNSPLCTGSPVQELRRASPSCTSERRDTARVGPSARRSSSRAVRSSVAPRLWGAQPKRRRRRTPCGSCAPAW